MRLALTLGGLIAVTPALASAQRTDAALAVSRICVSESGWDAPDECATITAALRDRAEARGLRLLTLARRYAPRSFDRSRTDRRRWIAHLHTGTRRPEGWPAGARWSRYRPRFVALIGVVRSVLAGERESGCPGAEHWSAQWCVECRERMREAGFVRAGCGMRNAWWRREGEG